MVWVRGADVWMDVWVGWMMKKEEMDASLPCCVNDVAATCLQNRVGQGAAPHSHDLLLLLVVGKERGMEENDDGACGSGCIDPLPPPSTPGALACMRDSMPKGKVDTASRGLAAHPPPCTGRTGLLASIQKDKDGQGEEKRGVGGGKDRAYDKMGTRERGWLSWPSSTGACSRRASLGGTRNNARRKETRQHSLAVR